MRLGLASKQGKAQSRRYGCSSFTVFVGVSFYLADVPLPLYQVLDCIKLLQEKSTLPIRRSKMRVRVTMPTKDGKRLKEQVTEGAEKVEDEDWGQDEWEVVSPDNHSLLNSALIWCICILDHVDRPGTIQSHQRVASE